MSLTAAALRKMLDLGLTLEQAVELAEVWEEGAALPAPSAAALRQKRYRERKAGITDGVTRDASPVTEHPYPLPPSPHTPQPPTPTRECVTTREAKAREEAGFDRFWAAYPRKTAKATARKAWPGAIGRASLEAMLAALARQREWEQWRRGIVPHAATWLNQSRWSDEDPEPTVIPLRKAPHDRPHHDAKFAARQANLATLERGADLAARYHGKP